MKTLILDNYDSFTFNLYQLFAGLGANPTVVRNDGMNIEEVKHGGFTHIVIGPGPGNPYTPRDIGISRQLLDLAMEQRLPLLGVCLGHQVMGVHMGGIVSRAPEPRHGAASRVSILQKDSPLLVGLEDGFLAMRYHSLHVEKPSLPPSMRAAAVSDDGVVMAMEHADLPLFGVQFHPESIGTPFGTLIARNFLLSPSRNAYQSLITSLLDDHGTSEERVHAFNRLIEAPINAELLALLAQNVRDRMLPIHLPHPLLDTCGTGGSGLSTINTSTLVAFIAAACGVKVAKHGNRAASGKCGCFDLLEMIGANIDCTPEQEERIFREVGIVFLNARTHHPILGKVAPLRKAYGKRTIFNLLGPLCNPARATHQLIGTGNHADAEIVRGALSLLGTTHAVIATGHDGLDEATVTGRTILRGIPSQETEEIIPIMFGLREYDSKDIEGGNPAENLRIFQDLMVGKGNPGHRSLILLNAALALEVAGVTSDHTEAISLARHALESGRVAALVREYVEHSQRPL